MSEPGNPEQSLRAYATLCLGILQIGTKRGRVFYASHRHEISHLPCGTAWNVMNVTVRGRSCSRQYSSHASGSYSVLAEEVMKLDQGNTRLTIPRLTGGAIRTWARWQVNRLCIYGRGQYSSRDSAPMILQIRSEAQVTRRNLDWNTHCGCLRWTFALFISAPTLDSPPK
jgi:hypothetical protein